MTEPQTLGIPVKQLPFPLDVSSTMPDQMFGTVEPQNSGNTRFPFPDFRPETGKSKDEDGKRNFRKAG